MVEIVGVHGARVFPDGTLELICANRVKKAIELIQTKEAELVVMLGTPAPYMFLYAIKFPNVDKNKILIEGKGRSSIEETKNFKENFVEPYGYKRIGKVSQSWHFPRLKMIDSHFFNLNYEIEYFEAEDGRNEEEIRKSVVKEKFGYVRDFLRLKVPFGESPKIESLLVLTEKLYNF